MSRGQELTGFWLYFFFFGAAVVRAFVNSLGDHRFALLPYALLGAFLVLSLLEFWLAAKRPVLVHPFMVVQTVLVLALLVIPPHHDYYAMLFISLTFPVTHALRPGRGYIWLGIFCVALIAGQLLAFGWPEGITYAPSYLVGVVFIGLYGWSIQRAESARARSDELAAKLQEANRRLREFADQAEELATAQERARLARELHDAVTQTIFSMNLTAQAARISLEEQPGKTPALLERLQELARDALAETRSLVDGLRPHTIAEVGLVSAMERHFALRQRRDGLHVSFRVDGEQRGDAPLMDALFRTTQEALNNVVRHAGATQATVELSFAEGGVTLRICDEGKGFDTTEGRHAEGYGLLTMRERVEKVGGTLRVSSASGKGTVVEARVPIGREPGNEREEAGRDQGAHR
jgi:signal transduction histidine kinase